MASTTRRFKRNMARIQPFAYERPKQPHVTRTFTEASRPDTPITLTLQAMEPHEVFHAASLAQEKIKKFITGDSDEDRAPIPFPPIGGEPVNINDLQCMATAQIVVMQRAAKGEEPYTFEELIALSYTFPTVWKGIQKMVGELQEMRGEPLKNPNGASTLPSCDSPCTTPTPILTLSIETTPLEEAQTPGKEPV